VLNYEWMPAVLFLVYLLYGLVRPWVSKAWQREIEEEIGEESRREGADESPEIIG
jgi:CDP-diacylglycerol--serine O-phosphatidyltransferase